MSSKMLILSQQLKDAVNLWIGLAECLLTKKLIIKKYFTSYNPWKNFFFKNFSRF
jgi:hypothetical protein